MQGSLSGLPGRSNRRDNRAGHARTTEPRPAYISELKAADGTPREISRGGCPEAKSDTVRP